jgi:chitodextrinase
VRVEVSDAAGAADQAEATIRVGTAAPQPTISTPVSGAAVAVGGSVDLSGGAIVPGTGELPPRRWPDGLTTNERGTFACVSWSDGGARAHDVVVPPGGTTLTASYAPSP